MTYIQNTKQLLSNGDPKKRQLALDIIEYALSKADPYQAAQDLISIKGDLLSVGKLCFELNKKRRVFILGAGKATFPICKALEDILGDRISGGVVVCKYGQEGELLYSELCLADHPIPDKAGFDAAQKVFRLAQQTQPLDIVFCCITGGSSALLPLPVEGVSLADKALTNKHLLHCGANIIEINAVRKHLSQIKGGRLAKAIHPQADLVNLTVSDVIGDPLDYITDPTVPDTSTFDDARKTLSKYDLWRKIPFSVRQHIENADAELETPKEVDLSLHKRHDFIIVKGDAACEGAAQKAKALGFNTMILSTRLEGESKELGRTFAAIASEIRTNCRPLSPPCAIIGGGETTVYIEGPTGEGGPNQEFAVGAALYIENLNKVLIVGLDTDGTDGPSDIAGTIVDSGSVSRAHRLDLDLYSSLQNHDVTTALRKMGDAIETGATGTNVNDLKFMLVFPQH